MSTETTGRTPRPTTLSGFVLLGFGTLAVALILGMIWMTGPDKLDVTLSWLSSSGALAATLLSGVAIAQGKKISSDVAQVQHQTNGALDARIRAAIDAAIAATLAGVNTPVPTPIPTPYIPPATSVTADAAAS